MGGLYSEIGRNTINCYPSTNAFDHKSKYFSSVIDSSCKLHIKLWSYKPGVFSVFTGKISKFPSTISAGFYLVFTWIFVDIQTWKNCNFSRFGFYFVFCNVQNWKIMQYQTWFKYNPNLDLLYHKFGL